MAKPITLVVALLRAIQYRRRRSKTALGYHYNAIGQLVKVTAVDPTRLPRRCTVQPPPWPPDGYNVAWSGESWDIEANCLTEMAIADYQHKRRWLYIPWALSTAFQFLRGNHESSKFDG
ncbi:MAG: hypothetical protein AAF609_12620 [Cyanobacteria bacterium P01_C01_bin.120]